MKRKEFTTIEIDPVSGEYTMVIPEWLLNDEGWYEGTRIRFDIDNGDIIISEDTDPE
tara:strand:- start:402 stop:572 length:171 start_codon:yes stop_codon:yes gene_type:complete